MSGREWKPGDVAMVRNEYGVWNRAICSVKPIGIVWQYGVSDSLAAINAEARPLVVIDPEDECVAEDLVKAFVAGGVWRVIPADVDSHEYRRQQIQDVLRSLVRDQPEEPTDPKARVEDRRDNVWRLLADGEWVCTSGPDIGEYLTWSGLVQRGPLEVSA